jgi:hypothetical protein
MEPNEFYQKAGTVHEYTLVYTLIRNNGLGTKKCFTLKAIFIVKLVDAQLFNKYSSV